MHRHYHSLSSCCPVIGTMLQTLLYKSCHLEYRLLRLGSGTDKWGIGFNFHQGQEIISLQHPNRRCSRRPKPLPCSSSSARGDDWSSGKIWPLREIWSLSQWNIYRVWSVVFLDVTLCRGLNRSRRFEERSVFIFKACRHYIHSKLYDLTEILQIRSCTLYRVFEKTVSILLRLNKKEKITNSVTSLFILITTHCIVLLIE